MHSAYKCRLFPHFVNISLLLMHMNKQNTSCSSWHFAGLSVSRNKRVEIQAYLRIKFIFIEIAERTLDDAAGASRTNFYEFEDQGQKIDEFRVCSHLSSQCSEFQRCYENKTIIYICTANK